jgi:microcin C transport system substrate-binding protein
LIIGQIAILPKHYWTAEGRKFGETTLTPPLGSGPYKIGSVKPGESIEYTRVSDWWAKDLPVNVGRYNFDKLVFEYYRDANVAFEAFLGGRYDFRQENTAKLWATAYESPAVKSGKIKKEVIDHKLPQGAQGFIFNLRKPIFQDISVRKAISAAFDFEWSNKQFAYDSYTRTRSYFSNSDMEAKGLPSAAELKILEPFRDQIDPGVFVEEFNPPKTDGSGNNRDRLAGANELLNKAGYPMGPDGIRVDSRTGKKLEFEFIDNNPAFERWIAPFIQNLKKIGIKANYRTIDQAQYQNRMNSFDYDMTVMVARKRAKGILGFRPRQHGRVAQLYRHQGPGHRCVDPADHRRENTRRTGYAVFRDGPYFAIRVLHGAELVFKRVASGVLG